MLGGDLGDGLGTVITLKERQMFSQVLWLHKRKCSAILDVKKAG